MPRLGVLVEHQIPFEHRDEGGPDRAADQHLEDQIGQRDGRDIGGIVGTSAEVGGDSRALGGSTD